MRVHGQVIGRYDQKSARRKEKAGGDSDMDLYDCQAESNPITLNHRT